MTVPVPSFALLTLLPVKELDALADRLHQKIRENPGLSAGQAGTAVAPPAPVARERGNQLVPEKSIDLVGQ